MENTEVAYQSLKEIRNRKSLLQKELQRDETKIGAQWHSLFGKPDALKKNRTPGSRLTSLMNAGAGILDAFILGFKLYRKFRR